MADPTPAVIAGRVPGGTMMHYGHKVVYSIVPLAGSQVTIQFEEITVTPPGVEGGDAINVHTQYSTDWIEKVPSALKDMTPLESTVAYDPAVYDSIEAAVNKEGTITIHWPVGNVTLLEPASLAFFGFLKAFIPGEMSEDGRPTASVTIQPTNRDPTNNVEAGPLYTAADLGP